MLLKLLLSSDILKQISSLIINKVTNILIPNQAQLSVVSDIGTNCLQRVLTEDSKSRRYQRTKGYHIDIKNISITCSFHYLKFDKETLY